jgi:hypothetical protein
MNPYREPGIPAQPEITWESLYKDVPAEWRALFEEQERLIHSLTETVEEQAAALRRVRNAIYGITQTRKSP